MNQQMASEATLNNDTQQYSLFVRIIGSIIRIGFYSLLGSSIMFSTMGYFWLKEAGIFDISDERLATITEYRPVDNSLVFDKDNEKIGEVFSRYHVMVPYKHLPTDLIKAIIAIEDRSFFEHQGIDLRGIARAVVDRIQNKRMQQGASTITQQLVRHFLLTKEKTIERKIREAILSIFLERKMPKEKILELYANVMFLGNGSYGVGAAARRYFDKDIKDLNTPELALIAGLFQSPSRYNPQRHPARAKQRQRQVLNAMWQSGFIDRDQFHAYLKAPLNYQTYQPLSNQIAPYFVDYIKDEAVRLLGSNILNKGLRIYTTLDSKLQNLAQEAFSERRDAFEMAERLVIIPYEHKGESPEVQGALISADPKTGAIRAMVGGRDYKTSKFNRTYQSLRQPGSSFKPVIYSLALSKGRMWSDMMFIAPIAINEYRPRNFSNSYLSETTMLRAFYKSINTPAIEIGESLGLDLVLNHAKNLGIETPLKIEFGSMLGSTDVTMLDMLRVYSTFANSGVATEVFAITKITDRHHKILYEAPSVNERSKTVMSPQDAYLMTEGLRSVFKHGTAYAQNDMGSYAAGKTGTSNKAKDNWFCGYTDKLTTVMWIGSDRSFEFMGKATGTSLALPVWATFMRKANTLYHPGAFVRPPGIVSFRVDPEYGHISETGQEMYFKDGQSPPQAQSALKVLSQSGQYRSIFDN